MVRYELIRPDPEDPGQGLAALPEPSPGDLFLDFESDPWALEGGLEFLIGTVVEENGEPAYATLWAHDRDAEKRAFESLIDTILARLETHPGMHVYHYGAYEAGAIKRLMGRYATREEEVDRLLRGRVLVDLFSVVRQGVRVSQESYSLKKVEKLYMPQREGPKTRPGFALVEYEKWLEHPDQQSILDGLAAYNRDDCVSTWMMRTWLEGLRKEAEAAFGIELGRPKAEDGAPTEEGAAQLEETRRRVEALTKDVPADVAQRTKEQHARWILAQLLDWHRREAKPQWWLHFTLMKAPIEELVAVVRRDRRAPVRPAGGDGRPVDPLPLPPRPRAGAQVPRGRRARTTRPRATPPAPSGPSTPPPARSTSSAGRGATHPTRPPSSPARRCGRQACATPSGAWPTP